MKTVIKFAKREKYILVILGTAALLAAVIWVDKV